MDMPTDRRRDLDLNNVSNDDVSVTATFARGSSDSTSRTLPYETWLRSTITDDPREGETETETDVTCRIVALFHRPTDTTFSNSGLD
jgi:hypothetical protein